MTWRHMKRTRTTLFLGLLSLAAARGERFTIEIPGGGTVSVEVPHVAPSGSLVAPGVPESPGFTPPSIFSAPLPSGSGARALGLAGAFTAVADDATAASWNPGGLIQLEHPEASVVLRASLEKQLHRSGEAGLEVGDDEFDSVGLNYASAVYPFRLKDRNFVFSLNLQEAYDFTQQFHANLNNATPGSDRETQTEIYKETVEETAREVARGRVTVVKVTSDLTTRKTSTLNQALDSSLLSEVDFDQQGVIYAASPALAAAITPTLSFGAAVNFYQEGPNSGQSVESRTRATYSGQSSSRVGVQDSLTTSGTYTYSGKIYYEYLGVVDSVPIEDGAGAYEPFTDSASRTESDTVYVDGTYDERNRFDDMEGINATLGALWAANRYLQFGFSIDLPWTAEAQQTKRVRSSTTTYDASRSRVLDVAESDETTVSDVEFDFPMRWAVGVLGRLSDRFYTTLDVSRTDWSDFAFTSSAGKVNPLDGSPYGENKIDDCWTVAAGLEYMVYLDRTEIPLRAGVAREERPAIGAPDEFWHFTAGAGLALGEEGRKVIFDIAYIYSLGRDVLDSLVPGRAISTDVEEHQVYVSSMLHF